MPRTQLLQYLLLGLVFFAVKSTVATPQEDISKQSLDELESRLTTIDEKRKQLAKLTFRQGVGNLGWLSEAAPEQSRQEWIEIQLNEETLIDQIALVPVLWHDAKLGIVPDGFPPRFQIIAGGNDDPTGRIVATFDSKTQASSRVAPFVFPIEPILAAWVRVEISEVAEARSNKRRFVQLSEFLIFSGQEIVSIDCEVLTSSSRRLRVYRAHMQKSPVDGFTPYLMDVQGGDYSQSYVAFYITQRGPIKFSIDLGASLPVNRLHFHAADLSENVPKIQHADYAFPKRMVVQGANRADYSDAVDLCEYYRETIYDAGPIIIKQFPETNCRYIRFVSLKGYIAPEAEGKASCVGFAEIEVFSQQENVALGKPVEVGPKIMAADSDVSALTDGKNHFGTIIPYREWIEQLAYRADLESERPAIVAELSSRYARQKANIRILSWTAGLLAIGLVFATLISRILNLRREAQLKERFAADLHDEIGADLHTIGLLSDLAEEARTHPEKLGKLLTQIRSNTEESGRSVRNMVQLQSGISKEGLESMMRRTAERTVTHLEHEFFVEGAQHLSDLPARTHSDLLRFYKECLVNVCRHSKATRLRTRLSSTQRQIDLIVSDNGQGISESAKDWVPKSLKRRAKLLGAKVRLEESKLGGTRIHLTLRRSIFKFTK